MVEERLHQLEMEFRKHKDDCDKRDARVDKLIEAQERCTAALERLTHDTSGVVELYNNAAGAVKVGISVQKFGLWLLKWPLIGAGLYAAYQWLIAHLPHP